MDASGVQRALEQFQNRASQSGRVLKDLYQLEEMIGEGGMGSVYAARHLHLQKRFAVKLFRDARETSSSALARFRQEAIAASGIDHPHIIDVVNFDLTEDGTVFMVMELLQGTDLSGLLFEGAIPVERALELTRQIGDALGAAHERGIVHRDLKPENIFVVDRGGKDFVKILDFGISKIRADGEEKDRITRTGQVLGTPRYISPEQARGESEVDHRADIYSLGAILYEMLCGKAPFEGRNYAHLLWQHANSLPENLAKRVQVNLPPAVVRAVMRSLHKEPGKRFNTVAEMLEALGIGPGQRTTTGNLSMSRPPIRPLASKRMAAYLAVALLALTGAFWWGGRSDTESKKVPAKAAAPSSGGEGLSEARGKGEPGGLQGGQVAGGQVAGEEDVAEQAAEQVGVQAAEQVGEQVAAEQAAEKAAGQTAEQVTMRFESRPAGAAVSVDGTVAGKTPLSAPVTVSGEKVRVTFSAPGHASRVITVAPAEGELVQVRLWRLRETAKPGPALPIKRKLR